MTNHPDDSLYLARAIRLAQRGRYTTKPNPSVGCLLVKAGRIIAEGWHRRAGEGHAEVEALKLAGNEARGATAYVSLEPCSHHGKTPPCADALINAGVVRVVAAMEDPNPLVAGNGIRRLQQAGIVTRCGLLADSAAALNRGYVMRMRQHRPLVISKLAMSLDGRTAMASGESQWITGPAARLDVHRLRARSSAVVTGIGTLLADNASLTARLDDPAIKVVQPLRVIIDSQLRTPPDSVMAALPGQSLIITVSNDSALRAALEQAGFEVVRVTATEHGKVDLTAMIGELVRRQINEVLIEAGATLNGALLSAGLIDELIIYQAPSMLGDRGRGLCHLPALDRLEQRIRLKLLDTRSVGDDLRLTYQVIKQSG